MSRNINRQLRLVTAPSEPVLELDAVKAHLRVDFNDDDDLIQGYITSAVEWLDGAEGILGRCLAPQVWAMDLDRFPRGRFGVHCEDVVISIPLPPVQAVTSVTYFDQSGAQQTLDQSQYLVHLGPMSEIEPAPGTPWPATQAGRRRAATITICSGYADGAIPAKIIQALLLLISHWYENRDAVVGVDNRDSSTELPLGVARLLAPATAYEF